jgi:hypothetical protein
MDVIFFSFALPAFDRHPYQRTGSWTVLPAEWSVVDLLAAFPALGERMARCNPVALPSSK